MAAGERPRRSPVRVRRRAVALGLLALACAGLSAGAAARGGDGGERFGALRTVVVAERGLARGSRIEAGSARRTLTTRRIPSAFAPPDVLAGPEAAIGSRVAVRIPAGSYLTASLLRRRAPHATGPAHRLPAGLRPVEVEVSAPPGSPAAAGSAPGSRVDVLAADEPGSTTNPRVHVLARDVRLLALEPNRGGSGADGSSGAGGWLATLALDHSQALAVIEADNYAREVRLLAR